jgi:hypothetical protein
MEDFIPKMQVQVSIRKSINIIYVMSELKEEKPSITKKFPRTGEWLKWWKP